MELSTLSRSIFAAAILTLSASGAWASATLGSPGNPVTGLLDGVPENLLGQDSGFAAGTGTNITALTDTDLEFLSADYGIGIDLFSNGLIQIYDNSGTGWVGSHVLTLSFSGLSSPLSSVAFSNIASLLSGSVSATVLSANTVQLTFTDVQLSGTFSTLEAQVAAVPEPSTAALLAAGALAMAWRRRSRRA